MSRNTNSAAGEACWFISARTGLIDEEPVPELQHHESPKMVSVVSASCLVVVPETPHAPGSEVAARHGALGQQKVCRHLAQVTSQPRAERDREAHLGAVDDIARHAAFQMALEEILRSRPTILEGRRKGGGELHHSMVQQGRPHLE